MPHSLVGTLRVQVCTRQKPGVSLFALAVACRAASVRVCVGLIAAGEAVTPSGQNAWSLAGA